jgi:hypothetical protein
LSFSARAILAFTGSVGALVYGLALGQFWRIDAPALAIASLGIAMIYLRKANWSSPLELESEYFPRSRIAHYCKISRIDVGPSTIRGYEPFERRLLGLERWRTMTFEELSNLAREVALEETGAIGVRH